MKSLFKTASQASTVNNQSRSLLISVKPQPSTHPVVTLLIHVTPTLNIVRIISANCSLVWIKIVVMIMARLFVKKGSFATLTLINANRSTQLLLISVVAILNAR